jgi:hypothetical protein
VRALVDAKGPGAPSGSPADVQHPDVAFDGSRIVFSGFSTEENAWRIYSIRPDGAGLTQVTRSDRRIDLSRYGSLAEKFKDYDDVDPCFLPDGRICFVSTRYPGLAPGGRLRATNLYVVSQDGSGLHRITTERFGADTPAVDPSTGRIVYSRWWLTAQKNPPPPGGPSPNRPPQYYGPVISARNFSPLVLRGVPDGDFPGVNNWSLAGINPDGTHLAMFSGYGLDREITMAYRPTFLPGGDALALFILQSPLLGYPGQDGLRRVSRPFAGTMAQEGGAQEEGSRPNTWPVALGGPQTFSGGASLPDPNPVVPLPPVRPPAYFYSSAAPLPDGRILVTGGPPMRTAGDQPTPVNIYIQENAAAPVLLYSDGGGAMSLDAVPLVSRPVPPVIADKAAPITSDEAPPTAKEAFSRGGKFTFNVENIHFNGPINDLMAGAPPFGRGLAIEFYMNPQRAGAAEPDPPILLGRKEIGRDGKVTFELPAGVPLFEVLRRADGRLGLGRDGQVFHVGGMNFGAAGQEARCVGCHAGHSALSVPQDPSLINLAPSAVVTANTTRRSFIPGVTFSPVVLVDRLTTPLASEWAASEDEIKPQIQLRWPVPVRVKEVVVHGTGSPGAAPGDRAQVIKAFTVSTYLDDALEEERLIHQEVRPEGTAAALDPDLELDTLRVTIQGEDVAGTYQGERGAALAEIEVTGQVAAGEPRAITIPGDANCDGQINVSDSIVILGALFQGTGPLCCEATGDLTRDGLLNISDPIALLGYLYRGTDPPPGYSPTCARIPTSTLTCDQEVCQ